MNLYDFLSRPFRAAAAVASPRGEARGSDPVMPRARAGQATIPSHLKTAKPSPDTALSRTERGLINKDITEYRTGGTTRDVIRDFVRAAPDLSAAVTSYVRVGVTEGYTAFASNPDSTVNAEATQALHLVLTRLNLLSSNPKGHDDSLTIRSVSEIWAREIVQYGAMSGELVLDRALMPLKIQPIHSNQIRRYPSADGKRMIPKQSIAGEEISLDVPTFFQVGLDQDLLEAYPVSPIEPALQAVLFSADFMNDIRRIVKRALHPRMVVTINQEKFLKSLPPEVLGDTDALIAARDATIAELQRQLNDLRPEEAMVLFDSVGIDVVDHGNTNLSNEYKVIQEMADAKMATGAKVLPTVLGKSGGTANTASAEVLMFMKYVEGTVWAKLNEMFSKMLTLAVRLMGFDVAVTFTFNTIELRPESELEAFKSMKQSRILELLSFGFISDAQASLMLTGRLPPAGFKPLSGTRFRDSKAAVQPAGDGYNGATNQGSAFNKSTSPDTPKNPKSQNGGKEGN